MFKIESYITSIILANADRYIKNFRKQDAQVSLWEGDASFHNIDLNVDALNEELQTSFIFTSGYIHDLTIHVPWTKLMSEPVTISVNTIECVMRLKSRDEVPFRSAEKPPSTGPETKETTKKRQNDEIPNQSSYTSALTSKIMNNLSIRCENVILKLVEEDIVFSMNIEKFTFDNVNENWIQAMTEMSMEKLLTRKLIALSGVTICLDKQNSSGRIDTYLEPLLYRCQIHIRLLRAFNTPFSKKPTYTRFDILSDKMSFTISEPQIPMLMKLGVMIFRNNDNPSSTHSRNLSFNSDSISTKSDGSHLYSENAEENGDMTSWGTWLWNMVPSILSQDETVPNQSPDTAFSYVFQIGFCVKCLETNLKVLSHRVKKSSKIEFNHLLKSTFNGCIYQMVMKNHEWFNVQFGVNYVSIETPYQENDNPSPTNQFITAGTETDSDILKGTLFDEKSSDFINQFYNVDAAEKNAEFVSNVNNFYLLYNREFSFDSHLNLYTEYVLLEKTQAFAIDYVKTYQKSKIIQTKEYEPEEPVGFSDNESVEDYVPEPRSYRVEKHALLRFIFGPSVIKITPEVIDSVRYINKITPYGEYSTLRQTSAGVTESEYYSQSKYMPNYVTQFTFFDLAFEFHPTPSHNQILQSSSAGDLKRAEILNSLQSPSLLLSCKCIDGRTTCVRNITVEGREEVKKITMFKAVEIRCSISKLGRSSNLLKCEKFDFEWASDIQKLSKELRIETRNLSVTTSKSHLLLSYHIANYIWWSFTKPELKSKYFSKIFHSSLIEDSHLPGNVILEILIGNFVFKYKYLKSVSNFNISMNNCKSYVNELKGDMQKRVIIFSSESNSESPSIQIMLQRFSPTDDTCLYPSCIWFTMNDLKINLDVALYSWLMYDPVPALQEPSIKPSSSTKQQTVSNLSYRSAPSRKISESNSGGPRRYSNTPKPKESVHSSSEHEALSPPIIVDNETSDVFQLPPANDPIQEEMTWIEYLTNNIQLWRSLIVYGDISHISLYIPTGELQHRNESQNMEYLIKESFKNHPNQERGVFVVSLKSAKVKCDIPVNILEELKSESFVTFSKLGWTPDKLTFPWTISLSELSVNTLLNNCLNKPLLKPLSANCTVGVSIRDGNENQSVIALCVHSDFQPIIITLADKQVELVSDAIAILKSYCKSRQQTTSKEHLSKTLLSQNSSDSLISEKVQNKLTGWIQWTFTKCCVILYNKSNSEMRKLSVEFEDSIVSLEFDDIFHKMKLKIASFGIYHHIKLNKTDPWQKGQFHGVIVQRCYSQPANLEKKKGDGDGDDTFFLATITRARTSNLKTRLIPGQTSSEIVAYGSDRFVTEIILKISSTDVIVPFAILEPYVAVLLPLKKLFGRDQLDTATIEKSKDQSPACLPLVYLDIPKIRIFIPLSNCVKSDVNFSDTIVLEIGSAHLDCNPENPIIRKPLHPELYYSVARKTYASIEQKLLNQQYQLIISDISANTGIWNEIQKMLEKEHLSVEEPPSAFEQNPAVMWNQGCHPDSKNKVYLRHLSQILTKFSCQVLIAPPVESYSLKSIAHSAHYEIAALSDINVSVSLNQITLMTLFYKEFVNYILPHFSTPKDVKINQKPPQINGQMKMIDSGIESMDQSSAESSSVIKNKSEYKSSHVHSVNSKIFYSALSSNTSVMQQSSFLTRYENIKEIYITTQNINITVFKTNEAKNGDEMKITYDPLVNLTILQPYVLLNYENELSTAQFSIFNLTIRLPRIGSANLTQTHIPNIKDFPQMLLNAEKSNYDQYSKIKYPCFTLKTSLDANKRWKNEVILGQPLMIDCNVNTIQYVLSTSRSCSREFEKLIGIFEPFQERKRDQSVQTFEKEMKFIEKYRPHLPLISNTTLTTNRLVFIFKSGFKGRNLLLNMDSIDIRARSACVMKTPTESICFQCDVKNIFISLPELRVEPFYDIFHDNNSDRRKNDILSNMILKPWNFNVELYLIFQRWNLFDSNPWKCLKIHSENIIIEVTPLYLDSVSKLVSEYRKMYEANVSKNDLLFEIPPNEETTPIENYKDDLRAGAFQYIKNEVDKFELPSPYEVVFCNRPIQPYMCWKYPQPRCLTKLQIYPVPVEDINEDYLEEEISCQLQYYDEMKAMFIPHISFNLSENSIQTVNLPEGKFCTVAAECWRIVLYDMTEGGQNINNLKIDVRSLAGCVRVDSAFQPTLVPEQQIFISVSEIQINLCTLIKAENVAIENYKVDYVPSKQHFMSAICDDLKVFISSYNDNKNKTIEMSAICKANILNYEYLMFQSFVDPVFTEFAMYFSPETTPKLTGLFRNIHVRVSPNFIHTLSISRDLWRDWSPNCTSLWKVTAPFVICNNTNHNIVFGQEDSSEEIYLSPFECYLYAWHNPILPKSIKISAVLEMKKFNSGAVCIKKIGCNNLICENNEKTETSHLFVSVVKHSSVVNQVIIYGNLLIYNLTNSTMDMAVISHGKRDAKFSSSQVITRTNIAKNQLLSIMVPDSHKLSFKVRYSASFNDFENSHWSGLIPLAAFQQSTNQNSWMVKVPLKNQKEHFQSIWCQVTKEMVADSPKYLVVFRPLCSVISFLPWKTCVQISDDVGSVVSMNMVNGKGTHTELFVPNTVTLDKYTIEWKRNQQVEKSSKKISIERLPVDKNSSKEWSIHSLIEEISSDMEDNKWPYLDIEMPGFTWKTDKSYYEITPAINVIRKEEYGCGTKIEIYPWAVVVNMLSYPILLDISDTIYSIDSYEIIAPPCIESTFKLGINDGKDCFSGVLQLSDKQSFPIPKVTGRIPMNGFMTTMVECDKYVTFVNVASKNYKETRVISMCSSYTICNNTDIDIECAALVVCRTGSRSSMCFDIPSDLKSMSIELPAKQNSSVAQPIAKWYKIGKGDVQVLPYLILSVKGETGCPIRICDLSEKQRYSIMFPCTTNSNQNPACIFMTAQQNEGQVFLTIWNETVPQIIIHNMSQLPLNVTSSKSDRASAEVSHCPDWNWKYSIDASCTGYFHIPQQIVENKKKSLQYLKFAVKNLKPVKQTKWSCGVGVKTCINQLITLPLSQHHIKLAIFRNGFTYVVWIESATSDELSAKTIRARLSESFLPINNSAVPPVTEISSSHVEDSNEIPQKLVNLYSTGTSKPYDLSLLIEQISLTLTCDDDETFIENDISTLALESVSVTLNTIQKPNEVKEDIFCHIDVTNYRVHNEQFHVKTFDFPIVLLSKGAQNDELSKLSYNLRDLLYTFKQNEQNNALKINLAFRNDNIWAFDIRDLEVFITSQDVFLEDKYLTKLRAAFEDIFSATYDSSLLQSKYVTTSLTENELPSELRSLKITPNQSSPMKEKINEFSSNPRSSSSKSVNVSENDTDDKSLESIVIGVPASQKDDYERASSAMNYSSEPESDSTIKNSHIDSLNLIPIPSNIVALSKRIAKPLRLRYIRVSAFCATVSLHTSTTFYIALDRSPLNFSEFKKDYLVTTTFELGNLLMVHYFFGAVYGTGWAISSLEFVGSPGVLARSVGTGIKDFVSMPIYGIASGPRGFVLGVAHGSASLMKHVMAGTLSSVTKFAGSWARTLDRFTLDPDDLLQSEEIRRFPPSNIAEGVLQGLSEFGISVLGGISGLAHHPLQYAVSSTGNRSLINSISLGIIGVLTRPLSGAAELVARTGQGILSHVGWNTVPMIRNEPSFEQNFTHLQVCCLKYEWKRDNDDVLFTIEAVNAENLTIPLWITLTRRWLNVAEMTPNGRRTAYRVHTHEFKGSETDPTLIVVLKPALNLQMADGFTKARIIKYVTETNHCCSIENSCFRENSYNELETVFSFYVNPRVKNFLLNMISFTKNVPE